MKKLCLLMSLCMLLTGCGIAANTEASTTPSNTTLPPTGSTTSSSTTSSSTTSSNTTSSSTSQNTTPPPPVLPSIPMPEGAIDVVKQLGVKAGKGFGNENALILGEQLNFAKEGTILYFPRGEYEIGLPLYLTAKRNIQIVGDYATLIRTGVTNTKAKQEISNDPDIPKELRPYTASSAFFAVNECDGISFLGLIFKYDIPTSLSGKITAKDGGTLTLEISDGATITGEEYVTIVNSFNKSGVITKIFEQYAATNFPVEKLSENTLRVSGLDANGLRKLSVGSYACLRMSTSSNYVFELSHTTNVTFDTLTIRNSLNGGMLVTGRCGNVTLKDVTVQPENSNTLMSTNADILHISDMSGTLMVENCHFEKPGDDCVNVHGMAYKVDSVSGNSTTVSAPRFSFSSSWGKAGDVIEFFDAETFASLGTATITSTNRNVYTFDKMPDGVKAGTVISNASMHPSVIIRDTTAENNRARGFLLQTDNVIVENCHFKNTALAAILIAPDLDYWYEMSPARHILIQNNTFENCGGSAAGVIQLSADHDDAGKRYTSYIHSDIQIIGNTFISQKKMLALFGVCVENLTFADNDFTEFFSIYRTSLTYCNFVTLGEAEAANASLTEVTNAVSAS